MSAADVPELVAAGGKYIAALRRSAKLSGEVDPSPHSLSRAALMAVPAPLRPIDPNDDELQQAVCSLMGLDSDGEDLGPTDAWIVLTALCDLGVGLPARAEPSDAAVETAVLWRAMMDTADAACVRCDAPQLTDLLDALARVW